MKTVYLNLNILDIRCGGTDNTKERCCYISIVAPCIQILPAPAEGANENIGGFHY